MLNDCAQYWEMVYCGKVLDRVSWFEEAFDTLMALLWAQGMMFVDVVVDIGGGALRLVDVLIA